jgi:V/A-type H+-transporting ATPase subunit F
MYLISDNADTLTGMRLAGVDGVIANEKGTLEKALNEVLKDKNIGIILLTEALGKKYPELVKTVRTEHKKPLLIEILFRGQTNLITQQNHALFIDRCSQRGSTSRLYLQCHHIRSPSWIDIPNNFLIEYNQTNNIFIQNGNIINFAHHCYNINQFIIIKIQYHYK